MVVGMVYAKSVNLPQIASYAKPADTQLEARVQRLERVLKCRKLVPLEILKPISKRVLATLSKSSNKPLMILMDRSMINDTLNLLSISVGFGGRALPLGWVLVSHEGNSDLRVAARIIELVERGLARKSASGDSGRP